MSKENKKITEQYLTEQIASLIKYYQTQLKLLRKLAEDQNMRIFCDVAENAETFGETEQCRIIHDTIHGDAHIISRATVDIRDIPEYMLERANNLDLIQNPEYDPGPREDYNTLPEAMQPIIKLMFELRERNISIKKQQTHN